MDGVDIAVIGGGIMGLCAAWRLAAAGHETVLFERYAIGHDRGSSHGATRIFRYAYTDPTYVRMAQAALPLWRELEGGDELVRITGGVDTGEPATVERTAQALESCGARVDRLDTHAIDERFPWLTIDGPAVFSPDTGVIAASKAVRTAAQRARDAGADLRDETSVLEVLVDGDDAVTVRTPDADVTARRAVIAAGGWMPEFLAAFGIEAPLEVTKESVFYHAGGDDLLPFIDWASVPKYAVPAFAGAAGVKVGEHGTGPPVSPHQRDFEPDERSAKRLRDYVAERLPTLDPDPLAAETCLYTSTPDNHFVIDVRGPVVFASPCSGHGFKFGPLVGETLACLAAGRTPPIEVAHFRLDRW